MYDKKKRKGWSRRDLVTAGGIATVAGALGRSTAVAATVDPSFALFGLKGSAAATPHALGTQIYESIGVYPARHRRGG
jgi:hypothetical protein